MLWDSETSSKMTGGLFFCHCEGFSPRQFFFYCHYSNWHLYSPLSFKQKKSAKENLSHNLRSLFVIANE